MIELVKSHIFNSFGLDAETYDRFFIKVKGVDNYSLAKWISEEFDYVKVSVKNIEDYKFSDLDWIRVEPNNHTEFTLTD